MRNKILVLCILVLLTAGGVFAQNSTTVTVNVTDAGSTAWANGTYQFQFVGQIGSSWPGGGLANLYPTAPGALNGSGSASQSVPSNATITPSPSYWNLTVCPSSALTLPGSGCYTQQYTVKGSSQTINITPPAISIPVPSVPTNINPVVAYADSEISGGWAGFTYFNVTLLVNRTCTALSGSTCSTWISGGGGGGVSSITGDGTLINNSLSTGAVTLTLGNTPAYAGLANTFTAANDFTGATIKVPLAASCVATLSNQYCLDSTNKNVHMWANNVDTLNMGAPASGSYTNNDCTKFTVVSGYVALADNGAACGFANPMTTLGDVLYGGSAGAATRLAGPTAAGTYTFVSKPSGGVAAAPTFALPGVPVNAQVGTSYTYLATDATTDRAGLTTFANASAQAITLPAGGGAGFGSNWTNLSCNQLAGIPTITTSTSTIDVYDPVAGTYTAPASSFTLATPGSCAFLYEDGSNNYHALKLSKAAAGSSGIPFGAGAGSVNVMTVTTAPAVATNATGTFVNVQPNLANTTTTPTLNVGGAGAQTIVKMGSSGSTIALLAGDYGTTAQNEYFSFVSNGTNWILLNPLSGQLGTNIYLDASGNLQCLTNISCQIGNTNNISQVTANVLSAGNSVQAAAIKGNSFGANVPIQGGQDTAVTSNFTVGGILVRGANETGASGTNIAGYAGFGGGAVTSAAGNQGLTWFWEPFFGGGTNTLWNLECESAAMTVNDCGASPTTVIGIASNAASPILVVTYGTSPVNASAAVTLGHTVCAGSTAGKVTDSGGLAACTLGTEVGIVMATSGTYNLPTGGTVTLSTTLPLIHMKVD